MPENNPIPENSPASASRDALIEKLCEHFGMNSSEGTYWHVLTRDKSARHVGTLKVDDFTEIDEELVAEIADIVMAYPSPFASLRLAEQRLHDLHPEYAKSYLRLVVERGLVGKPETLPERWDVLRDFVSSNNLKGVLGDLAPGPTPDDVEDLARSLYDGFNNNSGDAGKYDSLAMSDFFREPFRMAARKLLAEYSLTPRKTS